MTSWAMLRTHEGQVVGGARGPPQQDRFRQCSERPSLLLASPHTIVALVLSVELVLKAAYEHPGRAQPRRGGNCPLRQGSREDKFLDPVRDGAVLPILHLYGYKIADPTVLARAPKEELRELLAGCGHEACVVEGDEPAAMHQEMAAVLDSAYSGRRCSPFQPAFTRS
jgi:hypothetical protein